MIWSIFFPLLQKFSDFFKILLHYSTTHGIMSVFTGLGGKAMVMLNNAAQFYFCYYYFFGEKR